MYAIRSYYEAEVIPLLLHENTDLIGQAQTGTGKTAAFGLPLLSRISPKHKAVQALVLSPTRELGQQIAKQFFKFTKYTDKIFTEAVYGGAPIENQIRALKRPTHVVVATPGRLIELIEKGAVDLTNVQTIVLDEADEMLTLGFKKELDIILKTLANVENKWLFSATMPIGIKDIIKKHLSAKAKFIQVGNKKEKVNKNIDHQFVVCEEEEKLHVLLQMINANRDTRGVVFCKTKVATQKLIKQLQAKNISADGIHGDLKQIERDKVMRAFKNESLKILVATDLAARGLDINDLAYVVHYQLPDKDEYYIHRSGRTARGGKRGISLAIVTTQELKQIKYFQKALNIVFKQIRGKR